MLLISKTSYLKSDMITEQERVIELQEELLAAKGVHLQDIQENKALILSEILLRLSSDHIAKH